jgi:hypothetical protein
MLVSAIALSNRGYSDDKTETLRAESHGAIPMVASFSAGSSSDSYSVAYSEDVTPPLRAGSSGTNQTPTICLAATLNSGGNNGGFRTEPGEHLVFDNLPNTLYNKGIKNNKEVSNAGQKETNPRKVLSILRQEIGEEAFAEWGLGILNSLQQEKILQPYLHGAIIRTETKEKKSWMDDCSLPRTKDSQARGLYEMWVTQCLGCTSQRWELAEQLAKKLGTYLSQLSQQNSSQTEALYNLWQASKGIRVLRLQGFPDNWTAGQSDSARYRQLGNAVAVPVAKWLARRILKN